MSPGFPTRQGIKGSKDNICPSQRAESIQAATMSPTSLPIAVTPPSFLSTAHYPRASLQHFQARNSSAFLPHCTLPSSPAMPRCWEEEPTSAWGTPGWTHTWQDAAQLSPGSFWVIFGAASRAVPKQIFYSQPELTSLTASAFFLPLLQKKWLLNSSWRFHARSTFSR